MTTPAVTISMSQIIAEFGANDDDQSEFQTKLGSYRISQRIAGRDWPLDTDVPSSGPISFSQLRGKTLNVVVDYSGGTEFGVNSQGEYDARGVVVGGFRTRPASNAASTKKVYHIIRKSIGGKKLVASLTPTAPVDPVTTQSTRRTLFNLYNINPPQPNTLGVFVSKTEISTGNGFSFGGRNFGREIPTLGLKSNTNTSSGHLSGTGGSVFLFNQNVTVTTQLETTTTYGYSKGGAVAINVRKYYDVSRTSYSYSLVEAGYATRGASISVTWPGVKSFDFTVTDISSGISFITGSTWNSATLYYIITSIGRIIGSGGDGGNKTYPNGEPGGHAFGAQVNCNLIIEPGGVLAGGGGGGGRGGDYSFSSCGNCIFGCCGGWGCSVSGGDGGFGAGLSPSVNRTNATAGGGGGGCRGGGGGKGGDGGEYGQPGGSGATPGSTGPKNNFWLSESESRGSGGSNGSAGYATIRSGGVVINIDQRQGAILAGATY